MIDVLILKRQELCVRSCTLIQGVSITLVLAFPISQVATKYAIRSSKAALHQKTLERLSQYDSVRCFLDNDEAGRNAYLQLSKELGKSVTDASTLYNGYKDLNEYLCAKIKHSEKAENKKIKGIKL